MKIRSVIFSATLCAFGISGYAQTQETTTPKPEAKKPIEELRLKLNEDGTHYIKATFLNQIWFTGNQSNPNSTLLGATAPRTFDIGLRRTRFQLYGTLTDHVTFYFQLGQNNFNFATSNADNRKINFFIHDALAEYKIKKNSDLLILGGGLTITNGLSRFSNASIGTFMTLDGPITAAATVDQTDEFERKLSVYARGQISHLDYRLVLSDPFPINTNGTSTTTPVAGGPAVFVANPLTNITYPTSVNSAFAQAQHHKQYQGLFSWNFMEKESHVTPYMTGTYLGTKKVFNLEAGFITQKNATWSYDGATPTAAKPANTTYHTMNLWSVGAFYDAPVSTEKGTAFNAYAGFFHTDYGKGYLRYNGIMNATSGNSVANLNSVGSFGNAFPMFGTGNVFYSQIGYLMRRDLFGEGNGTLMPYVTFQSANYQRLDKEMNLFDIGINWFIKGHSSKFTLDYQNRPAYDATNVNKLELRSQRLSMLNLQYQISF